MRATRIGIVPEVHRPTGGVYQYSVSMIRALQDLDLPDEFFLFHPEGERPPEGLVTSARWNVIEMPRKRSLLGRAKHAVATIVGREVADRIRSAASRLRLAGRKSAKQTDFDTVHRDLKWVNWFGQFELDLMLWPNHSTLSFQLGVPYVISIHDLQHRLQPEFPEVSADGEWESREYGLRNCIRYATLVLTDSEAGKQDVLRFYGEFGVSDEAVKVLPLLPASYLACPTEGEEERVRRQYSLPERYLFYPAQFWPHKNHLRIVQALASLKSKGVGVALVLTGSHTGPIRERTFAEAMRAARELGVRDEVIYLGYVPDEAMASLYSLSAGLMMPTFFGPSNIPIIEAFSLGCPVITSDIRGIREQVGDAALRVDPRLVESIAEAARVLLTQPELSERLTKLGRERVASFTAEDYRGLLASIIDEAKNLVAQPEGPQTTEIVSGRNRPE